MFCITFFIFFGFYKFISRNIFFVFCSIFLWSNSLTFFIHVFCYYICSRSSSFLLVDVFYIALIISCGFYKVVSFDIFFVFCSIFHWSNSLTFFIHVFCYYICSRSSSFLLVDMNSIAVFISCSFYKLIAIYILLRIVTFCRFRNFISFFINKLSNLLRLRCFPSVNIDNVAIRICFCS